MVSRATAVGGAATALGVVGYVAGVLVAYPGRAFTLTLAMVGITILIIGDDWEDDR